MLPIILLLTNEIASRQEVGHASIHGAEQISVSIELSLS